MGGIISAPQPGKFCLLFSIIKIMFPSGAKGKFVYCSLQTWFLSQNATHFLCGVTYLPLPHTVGTVPQGTCKKWCSFHGFLMSNKLSIVSDPGISCLQSSWSYGFMNGKLTCCLQIVYNTRKFFWYNFDTLLTLHSPSLCFLVIFDEGLSVQASFHLKCSSLIILISVNLLL